MKRFRFSRRAEQDIDEVADYIARDNPERAARFVAELRERCRRIVAHPTAAPLRPDIGEGVRMVIFGNYLILYVEHYDLLEIRRVVHGARNLKALE